MAGIKLQHTFAFRENSYSAGKVVRTISEIGSVPKCPLSYEQDAACKSFTYLARDRKCELKDGQGHTDVPAEMVRVPETSSSRNRSACLPKQSPISA